MGIRVRAVMTMKLFLLLWCLFWDLFLLFLYEYIPNKLPPQPALALVGSMGKRMFIFMSFSLICRRENRMKLYLKIPPFHWTSLILDE
jgi:hypothetical protein